MENPNWSAESMQAELDLHLTAAAFILEQLINRHGLHQKPEFSYVLDNDRYRVEVSDE